MDGRSNISAMGIDVGGTEIKGGLVTRDGHHVVEKQAIATEVAGGVDHVVERMTRLIESLRQCAASASLEIRGVGLGMPGTLDRHRGMVVAPPNLPGWRDVPIVARLSSLTELRVVLDNDANNAALGEYLCGAGRGVRDMVMLTLGTGIGGGIVVDGRLWRGSQGNAGELGHMIVHVGGRPCTCGQSGCLEAYASAGATAARATELVAAGEASSLKAVVAGGRTIHSRDVVEAAKAGDAVAMQVWDTTCRYLAVGCLNINHILEPERIVLAGGMSAAGEFLRKPVVEAVAAMASGMLTETPDVRIAELGNDAGFVGAALSVFQDGGAVDP